MRLLVEVFKGSAKAAIRPLRPSPVPSRSRSRGLAPAAPAWPRRRRRSRPRPPGREGGEGAGGSRSFGLWGILIAVARARVLDADAGEGRRIHVRGDIGALLYASDLSFPSHTRSCTWRHLAAWRLAPLGGLAPQRAAAAAARHAGQLDRACFFPAPLAFALARQSSFCLDSRPLDRTSDLRLLLTATSGSTCSDALQGSLTAAAVRIRSRSRRRSRSGVAGVRDAGRGSTPLPCRCGEAGELALEPWRCQMAGRGRSSTAGGSYAHASDTM